MPLRRPWRAASARRGSPVPAPRSATWTGPRARHARPARPAGASAGSSASPSRAKAPPASAPCACHRAARRRVRRRRLVVAPEHPDVPAEAVADRLQEAGQHLVLSGGLGQHLADRVLHRQPDPGVLAHGVLGEGHDAAARALRVGHREGRVLGEERRAVAPPEQLVVQAHGPAAVPGVQQRAVGLREGAPVRAGVVDRVVHVAAEQLRVAVVAQDAHGRRVGEQAAARRRRRRRRRRRAHPGAHGARARGLSRPTRLSWVPPGRVDCDPGSNARTRRIDITARRESGAASPRGPRRPRRGPDPPRHRRAGTVGSRPGGRARRPLNQAFRIDT